MTMTGEEKVNALQTRIVFVRLLLFVAFDSSPRLESKWFVERIG
jgi:hypothetical protein